VHWVEVGRTNSTQLLERANSVLQVAGLLNLSESGSLLTVSNAWVRNLVCCTVVLGEDRLGRVSLTMKDSSVRLGIEATGFDLLTRFFLRRKVDEIEWL